MLLVSEDLACLRIRTWLPRSRPTATAWLSPWRDDFLQSCYATHYKRTTLNMKRMQLAATSQPATIGPAYDQHECDAGLPSSGEVEQSVFVPLHYEKKYAYPLIVWLHNRGDNERQLKRVMPRISLRNYVAVAPRGLRQVSHAPGQAFEWRQGTADILDAQWKLTQCIESVKARYNIHSSRVFVGGLADGGTMALRLALRMPHICAGAFSIGGPIPTTHAPLLNVERARRTPVLLLHGNQSRDYSPARACDDLRLLHAAGMPVSIRQYPAADELTTKMLTDVDSWLMERVTGVPSEDPQPACDQGEWN